MCHDYHGFKWQKKKSLIFYDKICHEMSFVAPLNVFSCIIKMDGLKNHDLL
jgi:hypothetical protein